MKLQAWVVAGLLVLPGFARADDATPVRAATLVPVKWQNSVQLTANIKAEQDAALAAQRPGQVVAVLYESGQTVAAGKVLLQLNDAAERAQLAVDQAKLTEMRDALARAEKLMTINGASRAALEQAQADAAEATAQVAADTAMLAEQSITAPFAGVMGIRNVSLGDYIAQGQVVAHITQTAPLRVLFSIPQTEDASVAVGDEFHVLSPAAATGHITALAPMVDAATNARAAEGRLSEGAGNFVPGSFATISLAVGNTSNAYAVPATALNDSLIGTYLFVITTKNGGDVLSTVYVTQLGTRGDEAIIGPENLHAGDRVVAIGGFKLSDGAAVTINP